MVVLHWRGPPRRRQAPPPAVLQPPGGKRRPRDAARRSPDHGNAQGAATAANEPARYGGARAHDAGQTVGDRKGHRIGEDKQVDGARHGHGIETCGGEDAADRHQHPHRVAVDHFAKDRAGQQGEQGRERGGIHHLLQPDAELLPQRYHQQRESIGEESQYQQQRDKAAGDYPPTEEHPVSPRIGMGQCSTVLRGIQSWRSMGNSLKKLACILRQMPAPGSPLAISAPLFPS